MTSFVGVTARKVQLYQYAAVLCLPQEHCCTAISNKFKAPKHVRFDPSSHYGIRIQLSVYFIASRYGTSSTTVVVDAIAFERRYNSLTVNCSVRRVPCTQLTWTAWARPGSVSLSDKMGYHCNNGKVKASASEGADVECAENVVNPCIFAQKNCRVV